jgi:hypothetical protein
MTYLAGIIGVTVVLLTTMAAALAYSGPDGSAYSILNRKISTLGKPEYSAWSTLFNWGLMVGGVLWTGFIIGLCLFVQHKAIAPVALTGIVMAAGIVLVGLCPVTKPQCHKLAAQLVFFGGVMTVLLFTAVLLFSHQDRLSKWLSVPSAIASIAFISFVLILHVRYENPVRVFIKGPPGDERPYLWLPSLLEWLIFFAIIGWILILTLYLYWQERVEMSLYPRFSKQHQVDHL